MSIERTGAVSGYKSHKEINFESKQTLSALLADFRNKRTELKNGKSHYRYRRLRSAMNSIDFYLPYLFTYQEDGCSGMPNTNNKIEGTLTDLKRNLNNHSGMSETNRKLFVCGFFLALI